MEEIERKKNSTLIIVLIHNLEKIGSKVLTKPKSMTLKLQLREVSRDLNTFDVDHNQPHSKKTLLLSRWEICIKLIMCFETFVCCKSRWTIFLRYLKCLKSSHGYKQTKINLASLLRKSWRNIWSMNIQIGFFKELRYWKFEF